MKTNEKLPILLRLKAEEYAQVDIETFMLMRSAAEALENAVQGVKAMAEDDPLMREDPEAFALIAWRNLKNHAKGILGIIDV